MSVIKSAVKFLADRFLDKEEIKKEVIASLNPVERGALANAYLGVEAALAARGSKSYEDSLRAAKDFITLHYGAGSFTQAARNEVRKSSDASYYKVQVIDQVINAHAAENIVEAPAGTETIALALIQSLTANIREAKGDKNYITKRSNLRKAVERQLPGITKDRSALIVEILLSL